MSNIETLKQELIAQKTAIEAKGGTVSVANLNPSPSEITAGISTIEAPNLTDATATAGDVLVGKTFYAGSNEKKTGSFDLEKLVYGALMFQECSQAYTDKVYLTLAEGQTRIRNNAFRENYNNVVFTFNNEIQDIGDYAFYDCPNFEFTNFSDATNLTTISSYGFYKDTQLSDNLVELPPNLQTIGQAGLAEVATEGASIYLHDNITSLGMYALSHMSAYVKLKDIRFPTNYSNALPTGILQLTSFDCDIRLPDKVYELGTGFNYRGSFNNVSIPSSYKTIKDMCFGAVATDPLSNFHLQSVTFEGVSLPTAIGRNVFATQHLTNGIKIYVPDESIEEYKAIINFANYVNYMYPVSQKE